MSYVLGLFQEIIDECTNVQYEIQKLESQETDLKIKRQVLQKVVSISINESDIQYFTSEIQKITDEQKKVLQEKEKQQMLHRDLLRRISAIEMVVKQLEQKS